MNMSVAPQTTVRHLAGGRRNYGRGIVFRLPAYSASFDLYQLWQMVTEPVRFPILGRTMSERQPPAQRCCLPDAEVEVQIRERLDTAARELYLPPAAVVSDHYLKGDKVCKDMLQVLAVLSKSSKHVYLRDKEPNLAVLQPGRRVVVIVPEFSNQLEEAK